MKRFLSLAVVLIFVAGLIYVEKSSAQFGRKTIRASNNYISHTYSNISDFDAIVVSGAADIEYTPSSSPHLSIECPDNLFEYLKIEVKGGTLYIGHKDNVNFRGNFTINVDAKSKSLSQIRVSGSARIDIDETLNTGNLSVSISGSGKIEADEINCNNFNYSISGSGSVEIDKLKANDVKFSLSGSGNVKLGKLTSSSLNFSISGSGKLNIADLTGSSISSSISGSGEITLAGVADQATYRVSGSGRINSQELKLRRLSGSGSGVARISCYVTEKLEFKGSSSVSIELYGNPEVVDVSKEIRLTRR